MESRRSRSDSFSNTIRKLAPCSPKSSASFMARSSEKYLRIAVLGASGVGKTSIIKQFVLRSFSETYTETLEDLYKHRVQETESVVDILDTSGSCEYDYFRKQAIAGYDGFLLAFALNQESSFQYVSDIRRNILSMRKHEKVPILIVGTKNDIWQQRSAPDDVTREIVKSWKLPYLECSAKSYKSTSAVFDKIINMTTSAEEFERKSRKCGINEGRLFIKTSKVVDGVFTDDWMKLF